MTKLTPAIGDHDHVQGNPSARVTLVEYGDFQCPYCKRAHPIVQAVQKTLGDRLRFVFRNFPLRELHPYAEAAAEAAEAAGAQGKFWEMHDVLFETEDDLSPASLTRYAESVGLDVERWAHDVNRRAFRAHVERDMESGIRSGLHATPTFFINGVQHEGSYDQQTLEGALLAALEVRS
jgi:protein-disulfide isomerase